GGSNHLSRAPSGKPSPTRRRSLFSRANRLRREDDVAKRSLGRRTWDDEVAKRSLSRMTREDGVAKRSQGRGTREDDVAKRSSERVTREGDVRKASLDCGNSRLPIHNTLVRAIFMDHGWELLAAAGAIRLPN